MHTRLKSWMTQQKLLCICSTKTQDRSWGQEEGQPAYGVESGAGAGAGARRAGQLTESMFLEMMTVTL